MNTDKTIHFLLGFIRVHLCLSVVTSLFFFHASAFAQFTVTNDPAGPPLVGFGAQMNPYLYCKPNWGEVNDQNVRDFEQKVIALRPQHVRIFVLQNWFNGEADPISQGDPRTAESFIRTCELAQRAGATINLTLWYGPWTDPDRQMQQFAELLSNLIEKRKLTAIRYVTIQNEVNGGDKITMEVYNQLYTSLDAHLRRLRLRDKINIVGGDLVSSNQKAWFDNLQQNLAQVCDGYSMHAYWDYWDTAKLQRRISEVPPLLSTAPKPLYATEFGVRGKRDDPKVEPGIYEDGKPIAGKPLNALQLAWFMMESLNHGYVAAVVWTMEDAWYDRLMPYGLIGQAKDGWPLKPGYYMMRMFTHTCEPGWRAMKVTGESDNHLAAAVRSKDGKLTVYLMNRDAKPARLEVGGLADRALLHTIIWNRDGHGELLVGRDMRTNRGAVTVALPPMSVTALTTV
jgi:hypothetical protein